jgi:ABC-type uncharacterized transport system ATPase subunit
MPSTHYNNHFLYAHPAFFSFRWCSPQTDAVRTAIGICPQHDTLWPTLTVREHLEFYSRIKGVPPGPALTAAVDIALGRVGLAPFAHRMSSNLSGGQRRRLSLAIALCGDPDIIFADEPGTGERKERRGPVARERFWRGWCGKCGGGFYLQQTSGPPCCGSGTIPMTSLCLMLPRAAGLDAATRRAVWRVLASVRAGRVVVLVSHDMSEVRERIRGSTISQCRGQLGF